MNIGRRRARRRADHGSQKPFDRSGDGRAEAGLDHDHRREHRPVALGQMKQAAQQVGGQNGGGDAGGVAQFTLARPGGGQGPARQVRADETPPVAWAGLWHLGHRFAQHLQRRSHRRQLHALPGFAGEQLVAVDDRTVGAGDREMHRADRL